MRFVGMAILVFSLGLATTGYSLIDPEHTKYVGIVESFDDSSVTIRLSHESFKVPRSAVVEGMLVKEGCSIMAQLPLEVFLSRKVDSKPIKKPGSSKLNLKHLRSARE